MGKLFDNKFTDALAKLADLLLITVYFIVCSLPVVTIGAAMTSLYYVIHKSFYRGRGYTTEFFKSFKSNFKMSTVSWLIYIILFGVLSMDVYITRSIPAGSKLAAAPYFFVVLIVLTFMWAIYQFAYIARFENSLKQTFKNSAIIMIANLGWTALMFVIIAVLVYLAYRFMILILFTPMLITLCIHPIMEKLFYKYMSDEDKAKEEDQLD